MKPISPKSFSVVALVTLAVLFLGNVATSIILDPFNVFGLTKFNKRNFQPNLRHMKFEYLKNHEFSGYILGTSRVNMYATRLASILTGTKFYNLNSNSSTPYDMRRQFEWLIDRQPVEHLIFALDFDEFDAPLEHPAHDLAALEHPEVSKSSILYYWNYLWVHPNHYAIAIYGNLLKRDTWFKYDITTGHYYFPVYDRQKKRDPKTYIRERFRQNYEGYDWTPNPEHIRHFRDTVEQAKKNDIKISVVINPKNHRLYRAFDKVKFASWLTDIVEISGEVWDFSGLNSVTLNDELYYEESHFTFRVGDLVLKRLFGTDFDKSTLPADFGVRVTRSNLPERVEQLKNQ
jgi:hypothetical protein